ncbi:unnamed protein product, partial [Schistocephalus solidus]|uniref:Reverse transcriptase domain-containing protein n=1 Tax=Schistocephalus solidus TaxID=70667 RepID=A0A183TFJ7_SCHSO
MKNYFKATKAIYGPCIKGTAPLLSSDGTTLLAEKSLILKRWVEHFRNVLNCSSTISDAAIDRLPQLETNNDLDLPPSLPETIRAVQQISSGKEPGSDAIPPDVYKHEQDLLPESQCGFRRHRGTTDMTCQLQEKFQEMRTHLYTTFVDLNGHLKQGLLPESQCGFRRHCGTTDMIFAAHKLQKKCQEIRAHLYTTFVDLTNSFDTVNRDGLCKVGQKFGCPERFTHMVRQLHD